MYILINQTMDYQQSTFTAIKFKVYIKCFLQNWPCCFSKQKKKIEDFSSRMFVFVCLMVFSTTFNNISVISWWSVLFVEETGGAGENQQPVASH